MGYPSALYTIARYALEENDFPFPARAIFTMSETLESHARRAIEKAWQCRIYDRYGAVEGCMFASQCEYGHYHVSPEVGIIEILDRNGKPCPPGVLGEVVCTGLKNNLQPLIRYRVGDVACWSKDQHCSCNRQMPILERIEGRYEDICFTPDGREMLRFDTVFKGIENIKEAQVVQEQLNLFTIYVVPGRNFSSSDVELIQHNMKSHAGDVQTNVELVPEIPRSPSGKFRAVICKIPQNQRISSIR
jgi:phenylacetate-CoA ligase